MTTTKWLTDSLANAIGKGLTNESALPVLYSAGVMGGLLVLQQLLSGLRSWIQVAQAEVVQDHVKGLIHEKAIAVDYAFYESPDYFDKLQQANSEASARILGILENLGGLIQNGITFLSVAVILAAYAVWVPFVLFLGMVPALHVLLRYNRRYHDWWRQSTSRRRRAAYFDSVLVGEFSAAEMRVFGFGPFVIQQYRNLRDRLRREAIALNRRQTVATVAVSIQAIAVTGGVMGWMVWRAIVGSATIGDIALFYQAINQCQGLARSLLRNAGQLFANMIFLEHLFSFLEIESDINDPVNVRTPPQRVRKGITFEHVSFTYPGTSTPILEDFDLHLPVGRTVALVGANGAGKSTITKLLCRLYDPDQGCIRLDGIDIREFRLGAFREQISIMFQSPVRYQTTARENIALDREVSPDEARRAAEAAGAHDLIERLPLKYDNLLGRLFAGGAELSGGEWQRITLARAYLRQAPILILDEPTSSMDSWAELEWLERCRLLARGRVALIVTHRFTTAMQADVIYVMDAGKIIESGTHDELLALGGHYAASWTAQTRQALPVLEQV
ncbi:MAG TPA: ABC transporter ATP-binding protein [Rhodothermales bacterium]|nr:ABC transporter ATP-binding protein [Rhodothermales bacterium]